MPEAVRVALTVVVGVATGVLSAAFGVGGAVISTPAIRALGADALVAIGTTLPSILPSALVGTVRYRSEGLIRWKAVRWTGAAGAVSAVGGALLARHVPGHGHALMIVTAALMAFTAARLASTPRAPEPADPGGASRNRITPGRLIATGVVAGGLSGLLGVGGGIVMVPAFTSWLKLGIKEAVGTSLACVGLFAIPGTITHAVLGGVDWGFAIPLSIGVIPGARLGSALAIRASERGLRIAVAIGLAVIAVAYAAAEIAALR